MGRPDESELGLSMRQGVTPKELAEIRKEATKSGGDFPTKECITPNEYWDIRYGKIPKNFNARDIVELLAHITKCRFCDPMSMIQFPKSLSSLLKKKEVKRFLKELDLHFH